MYLFYIFKIYWLVGSFYGISTFVEKQGRTHVLLWTPTHGRAKAGRPARTYIQQLCEDTGCCPEDLPRAMNDREEWRERVRDIRATSATWWWWWTFVGYLIPNPLSLSIYIYIYIYIYIWFVSNLILNKLLELICWYTFKGLKVFLFSTINSIQYKLFLGYLRWCNG